MSISLATLHACTLCSDAAAAVATPCAYKRFRRRAQLLMRRHCRRADGGLIVASRLFRRFPRCQMARDASYGRAPASPIAMARRRPHERCRQADAVMRPLGARARLARFRALPPTRAPRYASAQAARRCKRKRSIFRASPQRRPMSHLSALCSRLSGRV